MKSVKSKTVNPMYMFSRIFIAKIDYNVCVCAVVRFRSRVLSPTQNVERRYKLWATRHRTIEESFYAIKSEASREKGSPSLT